MTETLSLNLGTREVNREFTLTCITFLTPTLRIMPLISLNMRAASLVWPVMSEHLRKSAPLWDTAVPFRKLVRAESRYPSSQMVRPVNSHSSSRLSTDFATSLPTAGASFSRAVSSDGGV